jgi:hypothetical protein
VKFVKPDVLNSASLSVGEDHGATNKLRASLLERAKDRRNLEFNFYRCSLGELEKRARAAECSDGPRRDRLVALKFLAGSFETLGNARIRRVEAAPSGIMRVGS